MQAHPKLFSFLLGLLSILCAFGVDGLIVKRSESLSDRYVRVPQTDPTLNTRHDYHGRSGKREQHSGVPLNSPMNRNKRQNGLDPESFVSNAMGGFSQGNSFISNESNGNSNPGGLPTNGQTTGVPASKSPSAGTLTPSTNAGGMPTNGQTSGVPASGNCNTNASPNGCANEDGPTTGDPGWTCGSGGIPNGRPATRDLLALSSKRQSSVPDYVATLNSWRCKFCLPPYTYDTAIDQRTQTQSINAASQGALIETPPPGQGTIMAQGTGADFTTAVLFWLCEVHTTNVDSCTCANVYTQHGFQWTERGHYDFLVGEQASQFGSVGCVYNAAMGGLWTCALGMK